MSEKKDLKGLIKDAIEAFSSGDLTANALHLLKTLGYASDLRAPLKKRTYAEFDDLYVRGNERFNTKNALTAQWLSIDLLFQLTADQLTKQDSLFRNEKVDQKEINSYLFFVLELKAKPNAQAYSRTELSQITREVNKLFAMSAMLLFKHADTITLSVIDRRLHKREASKDVLEKVTLIKDIRTSSPHRAHIEILFDLSIEELRRKHEFKTFPHLHEAWRKTLDTKELNKRFFRELANWYFHAVEVAEFPDDIERDREKRNATSIIRLITRLMFVWFLKEKDLVPEELFDPKALKKILKPDAKGESNYYKAILQNLFFATLNTEMGKRKFRSKAKEGRDPHYFIHNVFRYEDCFADPKAALKNIFDPIPFLNGGLFECLDKDKEVKANGKPEYIRVDGFSDHPKNKLHVPDKLFFDPEGAEWDSSKVYDLKKPKKEKVRGLIDILSSYKFTIVENTPIEEEVALDPELLGKVFENLLANYNPETKTTARKQTGSFYTPREIVNYMVDESLIAYLQNSIERSEENEKRLRHLLSYTEEPHTFTRKETEALIAAIDNCKILDPACGSGAFPMGVLHKLVHVLHKLDPQNKQWKERQVEKASALDDADIRERTIADIEDAFANNALDYGRKLYLIENGIYGVDLQPIAMQIAKLRFFISLIVDQRARPFDAVKSKDDNRGVRALPNLETKFVAANTLMRLHAEKRDLFTNPDIDDKKARLKRVRHDYFEARTPQRKEKCRQQDKKLREELAELLMLNHEFQPKEAKMLAGWDPYDQNASAPFFDTEWMFGTREGFDVVIGNPPYIPLEDMTEVDRKELKWRFPVFERKYETSAPFTLLGLDLLGPAGWLSYITPQTWETGENYARFREQLARTRALRIVINLPFNTFEAAYVDAGIFLLGKSPADSFKLFSFAKDESIGDLNSIPFTTVRATDLQAPQFKIPLDATAAAILTRAQIGQGFDLLGDITISTQGLARSSFPPTRKRLGKFVLPFLEKASSLKYAVAVESTHATDMTEHPSLIPFYEAAPKIFIRRIIGRDDRLVVGYYDQRLVTSKDLNPFIPSRPEVSAKYLLAVLGSALLSYLYQKSSSIAAKDDFRQTTLSELRKLPIPVAPAKVKAQLEKLVEKRLGLAAGAKAEAVEREINQVVYGLYGLTEEEIKIVEGSGKRKTLPTESTTTAAN
jgi:adenine-specific DNA-methyltransferase